MTENLNIISGKHSAKQIDIPDLAVVDLQLVGKDTILIADYNRRLLVLDASNPSQIIRVISLIERPYGLTTIEESLVAVSVGHNKLQIIDLRSESILQTIDVIHWINKPQNSEDNDSQENEQDGYDEHRMRLWDVAYFNRQFYFAAKDRIMKSDDSGTSCKTVAEIKDGWVFCIKIHNEKIYITNYRYGSFICLTLLGDTVFELKESDLKGPYGFSLDADGTFLVADLLDNSIHRIQSDGCRKKVVFSSSDGIVHPRTVISSNILGFYLVANSSGKTLLMFTSNCSNL